MQITKEELTNNSVKPEEAHKFICPLKYGQEKSLIISSTMITPPRLACAGKFCMAWRWIESQNAGHGFCGLASDSFRFFDCEYDAS